MEQKEEEEEEEEEEEDEEEARQTHTRIHLTTRKGKSRSGRARGEEKDRTEEGRCRSSSVVQRRMFVSIYLRRKKDVPATCVFGFLPFYASTRSHSFIRLVSQSLFLCSMVALLVLFPHLASTSSHTHSQCCTLLPWPVYTRALFTYFYPSYFWVSFIFISLSLERVSSSSSSSSSSSHAHTHS